MTTRIRKHGTHEKMNPMPDERIAAIRQVVTDKQYAKIDGTMIDLFTASAIVNVYDALNDVNRLIYAKLSAGRMGLVAFRLLK